jgi:NADH-quinone oxidoreductase subunit F
MDLHVVGPAATPAERAAVDALLDPVIGPANGGWAGGIRDAALDGHVARGGHEARARRDLLLPALEAAVARTGWLSHGALNHVCRRLSVPPAEAYGVATFYSLLPTIERPPVVAHVCDDLACRLAGAERVCEALEAELGPAGSPTHDGAATWLRSPCLGQCERPTAALVTIAGEAAGSLVVGEISDAAGVTDTLDWAVELAGSGPSRVRAELSTGAPDPLEWVRGLAPQAGSEDLRLLERVGRVDPTSLEAYQAAGGYVALRRALDIGPAAVVDEVIRARLVGRGGAAFPTGRKWAAVAAEADTTRYVVCNADESEPGTFKDRVILEEDPFVLIEAMTITGFAVGATRGFVYVRGEYPVARDRMASAIDQARTAGLLGPGIGGRDIEFDIELRVGAGAYIAGEETALFESLEGRRPEPRNKPPYPAEVGLFGKPTVIDNVETLANVPLILRIGGEAFASIGTDGSTGPKLFCVSGHVERPGVYELPFGATLREVIDLAGGVPGGRALQAVLLGGAAGAFVGPSELDLPLTFEDARASGVTIGSGVVMVMDETVDLSGVLQRIAAFFRDESCGQCVPCRVGTVRQDELLARLVSGHTLGSVDDELALFSDLAHAMRDASICGLGQTASTAIESAIRAGLVRFGASRGTALEGQA